jgi:glycerol kinase
VPDARTPLILAIDQGTTNSKALLVDAASGQVLVTGSAPVPISHPAPGWVEQDATAVWESVRAAIGACLARARTDRTVAALAVSNQRESVVAWSRTTGRPLGPLLGWQDARTSAACTQLAAAGGDATVRARTGLFLDPMYSAPKMRWLLDRALAGGADPDDVCLGTVDSWLVWNLTGGEELATDAGNASRTMLYDLRSLAWSPDLLDLFGVPERCLPEVRASSAAYGRTRGVPGLPDGLPVAAVMADSHAALYYHGCTEPGRGKATYGTGSSVMTPSPLSQQVPDGIVGTLAWMTADGPTYAREGNIVASGAALDWMARSLGCPAGISGGAFLTELASEATDAGGVSFVPAFSGLGAPYWDRAASGVLVGLTAGTTRAHLAYAALDGVAHQVADVIDAMEADGQASLEHLHADGGATASALLMQRQADLSDRVVLVADEPAASALGAARMAAIACGLGDEASALQPRAVTPVHPTGDRARRGEERARWHVAVARSRGLPVEQPTVAVGGRS